MKDVRPDPEIVAAVAPEHEAASKILSTAVATLAKPVSARGARTEDSALLDWLHAVQREQGKADLSFASLLPGSLPDWPAGPLTVGQIWEFYPYENTLVTVRATGRQVREALEAAGPVRVGRLAPGRKARLAAQPGRVGATTATRWKARSTRSTRRVRRGAACSCSGAEAKPSATRNPLRSR